MLDEGSRLLGFFGWARTAVLREGIQERLVTNFRP
jgi:hypothetical protein